MDKEVVKEYMAVTAGGVIAAGAIYFFMIPANIISGSITGLAVILTAIFPLPISLITLILNVACLLLGFVFIGREFGAKTIYASLLIPGAMGVLEFLFPDNQSLTGDVLLDMICLMVVISMGQALLFQANASSGGLDIIAKILNKYFHMELGRAIVVTGGLIIISSAFVYDTKTLVIGAVATYFNGIMVDQYIGGFTRKKKVSILSENYEQIKDYILNEISRGVTLYPVEGGYSGRARKEIITILDKNEYGKLMNYIHTVDTQAFITVSTVNEVVGMWNKVK